MTQENPAKRGRGAPFGPKNGNWRGGRFSRVATVAQRMAHQRKFWKAKRGARFAPGEVDPFANAQGIEAIEAVLGPIPTMDEMWEALRKG